MADVRQNLGLPPEKQDGDLLETTAMQLAPSQELLSTFIAACAQRYQRKVVDAGKPQPLNLTRGVGKRGRSNEKSSAPCRCLLTLACSFFEALSARPSALGV